MTNILEFYKLYPSAIWLTAIVFVYLLVLIFIIYDVCTWKGVEFDMEPEPDETVPESSNNEN